MAKVPIISGIPPIRAWDDRDGGGTWVLPSMSHTEAIPTLWTILHNINADWIKAAEERAVPAGLTGDDALYWKIEAFEELKTRYIQCLFSYINFFFTLENGFQVLLSELVELKNSLGLSIQSPKRPKRTGYLTVLRRVRNHTVVHWGGPEDKHTLDSQAGRYWGFSFPLDQDTIVGLTFGNGTVEGANERNLRPIPETHDHCIQYLKQFDVLCSDLLQKITDSLPVTVGTCTYRKTID